MLFVVVNCICDNVLSYIYINSPLCEFHNKECTNCPFLVLFGIDSNEMKTGEISDNTIYFLTLKKIYFLAVDTDVLFSSRPLYLCI